MKQRARRNMERGGATGVRATPSRFWMVICSRTLAGSRKQWSASRKRMTRDELESKRLPDSAKYRTKRLLSTYCAVPLPALNCRPSMR